MRTLLFASLSVLVAAGRASERTLTETVTPTEGGRALRDGMVRSSSGEPIAGAEILVSTPPIVRGMHELGPPEPAAPPTHTDAHGRYRFDELGRGIYGLTVRHRDYGEARVRLDVDGGSLWFPDITLHRGADVHGHVTLDGKPAASLRVRIIEQRPASDGRDWRFPQSFETHTDTGGVFHFPERIPPGSWTVHAHEDRPSLKPLHGYIQFKLTEIPLHATKTTNHAFLTFRVQTPEDPNDDR